MDSKETSFAIELKLQNFFTALKNLSRVEKVIVRLDELSQERLTQILWENHQKSNILKLLEFRVSNLVFNNSKYQEATFRGTLLETTFHIKRYACRKIEGIQSY